MPYMLDFSKPCCPQMIMILSFVLSRLPEAEPPNNGVGETRRYMYIVLPSLAVPMSSLVMCEPSVRRSKRS